MKVFEIAKKSGKDSKDVLSILKEAGIAVKTAISVIPEDSLARALEMFPEEVSHKVIHVEPVPPPKHVDNPVVIKLKESPIPSVPAEGMEPRFNQYAMGIRRKKENGKKVYSLLTFVFDPDTMEVKLLKEEVKRNEAAAIIDLKAGMVRRKVV